MTLRPFRSPFAHLLVVCFPVLTSYPVYALPAGEAGVVLGRVFEIDKKRYTEDVRDRTASGERDAPEASETGNVRPTDRRIEEYLEPRSHVEVIARQLETNQEFRSERTGGSGDYLISKLSPGVIEFKLRFEDREYPVAQRLDAKVNLAFLAELCFVIDKEEQAAWMVAAGPRRSPDVPDWVPEHCESQLSACLGSLTDEEGLRKGLLLIFAGSGAAATGIGIAATREKPASPLQ